MTDPGGVLDAITGVVDRAETKTLELETRANGIEVSRELVYETEVVEVELTDKLLKLNDLLDAFPTVEGRKAVQVQVARVKTLGERLGMVKNTPLF